MAPFHTPLDASKREIRLLKICRPHGHRRYLREHINCSLSVHSLDSEIEYDALSYVWGDPRRRKRIYVNGQPFYITENLFDALKNFIELGLTTRHFWIDAICINQLDLEERSAQVRIMGDIYKQSNVTFAWLGPFTGNLDSLQALLDHFESGELDYGRRDSTRKFFQEPFMPELIVDLAVRPYWTRAWVLQEILLSPEAIAILDPCFCPLRVLTQALWAYVEMKVLDGAFSFFESNLRQPELLWMYRFIFRFNHSANEQPSTRVLVNYANGEATDPRDLVYSLLSLLPSGLGIDPDYTVTFEAVCARTTCAVLRYDRRFNYLRYAGSFPGRSSEVSSWAVDLTTRQSSNPPNIDDFNACMESECLHLFCAEPGEQGDTRLRIRARRIDAIKSSAAPTGLRDPVSRSVDGHPRVRGPSFETERDFRDTIRQWRDTIEVSRDARSCPLSSLSFWGTVMMGWAADPDGNRIRWTISCAALAERFDDWLVDPANPKCESPYLAYLNDLKCFFTLKSGAIGSIENRIAQIGDVVVVAVGSPVPLLLRPVSPGAEDTTYQLVGMCYVDGIMDGEAVRSAAAEHGLDVESDDLSPLFERITLV